MIEQIDSVIKNAAAAANQLTAAVDAGHGVMLRAHAAAMDELNRARAVIVAADSALRGRETAVETREVAMAEREAKVERREQNLCAVRSDLALARAHNATHAKEVLELQAKMDKLREDRNAERSLRVLAERNLAALLAERERVAAATAVAS